MFDAGSVIAKIKADLTEFKDGINKAGESAKSFGTKLNDGIKDVTPTLRKASVGLAAIAATGTLMINDWLGAAKGAEVEMKRFDTTLQATGKSSDEVRSSLLKAAEAATKLGFDDEETANVLANFFQRTNDVTKAMDLNQVAMDLSRKKNIALSDAANLVTQVLSGNGKVLKQYGIDIKDSATPLEALAQLQNVVGGQAAAFMETAEGKSQALSVSIGNLKESLGTALIPILEQVTAVGQRVVDWLNSLSPATTEMIAKFVFFGTIIAAASAPLLLFITMIPAIVGGFAAIGAAITAIGAPVLAGIALIGLLVLAWQTNFLGLRDFLSNVFEQISAAIQLFAMAWEGDWYNIQSIAIGIFTVLQDFFSIFWETLKLAFSLAMMLITGDWKIGWSAMKDWAIAVFNALSSIAGVFWAGLKFAFTEGGKLIAEVWNSAMNGLKNIAINVWEGIKSAIKDGINWIIEKMNAVINAYSSVIGKVPGVGKKLVIPQIPYLAEGGIVTRPTIAMIGEGGESEAVIPLSKMGDMGGGNHFHFHDSIISSKEAAIEVLDSAMSRLQPRLGL